jgi:hypothetical protein
VAGIQLSLRGISCFHVLFTIIEPDNCRAEKELSDFVKTTTNKLQTRIRISLLMLLNSILEILADVYIASRREIQGRFEDFMKKLS